MVKKGILIGAVLIYVVAIVFFGPSDTLLSLGAILSGLLIYQLSRRSYKAMSGKDLFQKRFSWKRLSKFIAVAAAPLLLLLIVLLAIKDKDWFIKSDLFINFFLSSAFILALLPFGLYIYRFYYKEIYGEKTFYMGGRFSWKQFLVLLLFFIVPLIFIVLLMILTA